MGTTDLLQLIDLSLGSEPSGVVNFNYLHALMHAIVKRLGVVEEMRLSAVGVGAGLSAGGAVQTTDVGEDLDGGGGGGGGAGGGGGSEKSVSGVPSSASDRGKMEGKEGEGAEQPRRVASPTSSPPPPTPTPTGVDSKPSSSGGPRHRDGSSHFQKSKSTIVTAANDLGALERKLQELESRLNTMDTLPELLERKSSDMGATPMRDRWNYTNLSKRLSAAEDNLDQVG